MKGLGKFCCRTGDETGGLELRKQGVKRRSAGSFPGFLAGVACRLSGASLWDILNEPKL